MEKEERRDRSKKMNESEVMDKGNMLIDKSILLLKS